jgi:hypothetical protein
MKTLITLSVLQTVGIGWLVALAWNHERQIPAEYPVSSIDTRLLAAPVDGAAGSVAASIDEARLRAVIREELAELRRQSAQRLSAPPAVKAPHRDETVDQRRQDSVAQQIEAYRAVGKITDGEMQALQADIADLDEDSRREMMSKLIRALNSGELQGRLL